MNGIQMLCSCDGGFDRVPHEVYTMARSCCSMAGEHFLYFAFGSNLCTERLRLMNPTAEYVTNGRLR